MIETRPELRICAHCCRVMRGYGRWGHMWLCNTDDKDCYKAVTLYNHGTRCTICDPRLDSVSTWDEVKAHLARNWTDREWELFYEEVYNPGSVQRRLSKIRRLWRRKGR